MPGFDVIVVGAGLMGSAAARHLAKSGASVAIIGPGEPADKANHNGVFASHYDQARITRQLATSADWSRLSTNAINRYAEIERESGLQFYHEVGAMMAGPGSGSMARYISSVEAVNASHNIQALRYEERTLREDFPYFEFPLGTVAYFEPNKAGYINPRQHVLAELIAAKKAGAKHVQAEVSKIDESSNGVTLTTTQGETYQAQKVIVATGGFSKQPGLLPNTVPLTIYARTIAFFELDQAECERLKAMPSLIYGGENFTERVYVLPPVVYPDGKTYIKIGGDPTDIALETERDIKEWLRSDGSAAVGEHLSQELLSIMPDLRFRSVSTDSCVTSMSPTDRPLIYPQTDRIIALTGGNGAGAKCADELGRLGAKIANGRSLNGEGYNTCFAPEG